MLILFMGLFLDVIIFFFFEWKGFSAMHRYDAFDFLFFFVTRKILLVFQFFVSLLIF